MTQAINIETKIFLLLILILTVICFIPGGTSAFGGINASSLLGGGELIFQADSALRGFVDNQYRFGYGVFFTQGLVLLYFLGDIKHRAVLFRFAALALFIGGLARLSNIIEFGLVDNQVVGPTIIEIAVVPLLVLWHQRLVKK